MSEPHPAGAQGMLRAINERAVLALVDRVGPVSRVELAKLCGLSKPTVSAALASLVERRAVYEAGHVGGRKGPAAVLYAVEPGCAWALGVDIGHDRVRVAVADATGAVRARREEAAATHDLEALVRQVARLGEEVASDGGTTTEAVTQVVVGVPASVGAGGGDLQHTEGLPPGSERLGRRLTAVLPRPLLLENEVNLAALAEGTRGHGHGVDDFVLVSLGIGLGLGIVLRGRLHRGASGAAGEVGYLPGPGETAHDVVAPRVRDTVDATIGARHITATAARLGLPAGLSPREIFERARGGDTVASEVVADTARSLAYVIACVVPVLDPSLVVLGGSIGSNRDLLLDPVRRELPRLSPLAPRVECSELGAEAVLVGAVEAAVDLAKQAAFTRLTGAPAGPPAPR